MLANTAHPLTRSARQFLVSAVAGVALATAGSAVALGGTPAFAAAAALSSTDTPHTVPGSVMAGQVISRVAPTYPAEAKQKKIQGAVVLRAIIGKEGRIDNLTVISGPEELRTSALDAVRLWVYKPYLLNGEPTEVETTITVTYSLGESPAQSRGPGDSPQAQGTTSPHFEVAQRVIKAPDAIYPAEAKQQKVEGEVIVGLIVDRTGGVQDVVAISGPSALRQAAVDAVSQYQFRPATLQGEAVATKMQVAVNFQMF